MSSTVSSSSAVNLCKIAEPATLNHRSLASPEAVIVSIGLAAVDNRVSEREFIPHQLRTLTILPVVLVLSFASTFLRLQLRPAFQSHRGSHS